MQSRDMWERSASLHEPITTKRFAVRRLPAMTGDDAVKAHANKTAKQTWVKRVNMVYSSC